jgi:hypothetical protein
MAMSYTYLASCGVSNSHIDCARCAISKSELLEVVQSVGNVRGFLVCSMGKNWGTMLCVHYWLGGRAHLIGGSKYP